MSSLTSSGAEAALRQAALLLQDEQRWAEAESIALGVLSEFPVGASARQAREILDELDRLRPPAWLESPEVERARSSWESLSGLEDGRLIEVWRQITAEPRFLADLAPRIEVRLQSWIELLTHEIRRFVREGGEDPRDLFDKLEILLSRAAFHDLFEIPLRGALEGFRLARFELRLAEHVTEIARAIGRWDLARAREILDELGEPPGSLADDQLPELRRQLEKAEEEKESLDHLLGQLHAARPGDWLTFRRLLELQAEARERSAGNMPEPFRETLGAAIQQTGERLRSFIEVEARAVGNHEAVRELGRNLDRFESRLVAAGLELEAHWFDWPRQTLERSWRKSLREAKEPAHLDVFSAELALDAALLPKPLATLGRSWLLRVRMMAETWRTMRLGETFEVLAFEELPPKLKSEQKAQLKAAAQVEQGAQLLASSPESTRQARELAEKVLKQFPGHAAAGRLARKAERLEIAHDLDRRLEGLGERRFDLEAYGEVAGWPDAPPAHRALAERRQALGELDRLLAEEPVATTDAAAGWWSRFSDALKSLPDVLLPALDRRIQLEGRDRRAQWCSVLGRALAEEAPESTWRRLAAQLASASSEARLDPAGELKRYYSEVHRRGQLARVASLLDSGKLEPARVELGNIEGDPERKRDLEIRLSIEAPVERGDYLELANALDRYWGRAVAIYGNLAVEKLLRAFDEAWQADAQEALLVLRAVAQRGSRATDLEPASAHRLKDWLGWLEIEEKATAGLAPLQVLPLLDHLNALATGAREQRAGRLVAIWRRQGRRIALAWAFQALPRLRASLFADGVDPAFSMAADAAELVAEVEAFFRHSGDLGSDPPATLVEISRGLQKRGQDLKTEARELGFLLDELPFPVERFELGSGLDSALGQIAGVQKLLQDLEALARSDLRQGWERRIRCRVLLQEMPPAPWRSLLARLLDRWEPLIALRYDENRLHEAARRCGDPEALDEPEAFGILAGKLRVILEKLEQADCVQSPTGLAIEREYWRELPALAGSRSSVEAAADLPELIGLCEKLESNEQVYRSALAELNRREPPLGVGGYVEPGRHRDYFALLPAEAPASNRAFWLFERFLGFGQRQVLFRSAAEAELTPPWLQSVLKGGSP